MDELDGRVEILAIKVKKWKGPRWRNVKEWKQQKHERTDLLTQEEVLKFPGQESDC